MFPHVWFEFLSGSFILVVSESSYIAALTTETM